MRLGFETSGPHIYLGRSRKEREQRRHWHSLWAVDQGPLSARRGRGGRDSKGCYLPRIPTRRPPVLLGGSSRESHRSAYPPTEHEGDRLPRLAPGETAVAGVRAI